MAAAAGSGAPREEEGPGGDAAAPQPQAPTSVPGARLSRLPLARVKALVKADPDVTLAGQEAIFILARAAELFVETIAKDAYCCAQQGKRKTLQRRDLDNAIEAVDEFAFLEGAVLSCSIRCPRVERLWSTAGRGMHCVVTGNQLECWAVAGGFLCLVPGISKRGLWIDCWAGQFCEPAPASFSQNLRRPPL
ncbi:DNA polymerase epsilon subunit 4 isoform X1 [Vicugna pacos]|uniref:DNA polymerase epsilon subunit 4 isoform X1 n=1 Tax=Vicugna pacos TaxID=30538 RepID=A0ABM5BAX2_VICPA